MIFYLGTHVLSHAQYFDRTFLSIRRFRDSNRKSDIKVKNWILDSGAFKELEMYGEYRTTVEQYAAEIERWRKCGNMELAVTQDYMCEAFMLKRTGLTVLGHQRLTIERYDTLVSLVGTEIVMPVLQGYEPLEYVNHIRMYGDRLTNGIRVGVGSVCKRNSNPDAIISVLVAIKLARPDLKLHGFGLKKTSLQNAYISSLLYSADSMAWSYAARKQGKNQNGLKEAQEFTEWIEKYQSTKAQQLAMVAIPQGAKEGRRSMFDVYLSGD